MPDAARGHEGPDRRRLIGAVDAVNRLTEIKRERAPRADFSLSKDMGQEVPGLSRFRRVHAVGNQMEIKSNSNPRRCPAFS